jgi:hypothetical protein
VSHPGLCPWADEEGSRAGGRVGCGFGVREPAGCLGIYSMTVILYHSIIKEWKKYKINIFRKHCYSTNLNLLYL